MTTRLQLAGLKKILKRSVYSILGIGLALSIVAAPIFEQDIKAAANKVSETKENDLSEELKGELDIAAGKLTQGITDMSLKDCSKRVSGLLGTFSKSYSKVKDKYEAKKSKASASVSISITGSNDDGKSDYVKSDVLTYKYNSKMDRKVTDKEYEILCRIVEAEAGDQDVFGRILIVNVILNRVNYTKEFANDIEGVVFEKNQFSPITNGAYYSVEIDKVTEEAVRRALKGEDYSDGALYFIWRSGASRTGAAYFDTLNYLFKYGCHEFYKY